MPVCFFDDNYQEKYTCNYDFKDRGIEIDVDYDISDELNPDENGVRIIGGNTEYKNRDILIIDQNSHRNILVKHARFAGNTIVFCSPDCGAKTKFHASVYFEHENIEKISQLPTTPKIKKIRIFSKSLLDWIACQSLEFTKTQDYINYKILTARQGISMPIHHNGIKQITVGDDWRSSRSKEQHNISIDFLGYIEIDLYKRVNYDDTWEYVYELLVYMQLYCPDKFSIEKIQVMVDDSYYEMNIPLQAIKKKKSHVMPTVNCSLLEFLKECYIKIPYRKGNAENRNIPYVVLQTSRSLEDNFLMYYRFIECYYKKVLPKEKNTFISSSLSTYYASAHNLTEEQIDNYAHEIISLRNHYVHAGYYIKNHSLNIKFEKIGSKSNPKNYTVNNVDLDWIYERTKILYRCVIDIIFKEMLGYSQYKYTRHF